MSILPLWSPLFNPPGGKSNYRKLEVYFKCNEEDVKHFVPPPLKVASNILAVFVAKFRAGHTEHPSQLYFGESGILIPVKYKTATGAHMTVQYITSVEIVCLGRETYGYGNKYAERIELFEMENDIEGFVERLGKRLLYISCRLSEKKMELPNYFPRLQVKMIPRADGLGEDIKKVIEIPIPGYIRGEASTLKFGSGTVTFEKSETDPLYKLQPKEVLGATFSTGHFVLGYAKDIT